MKYFAYGSNMNEKRMFDRGINIIDRKPATLKGYKMIINKVSYKNPDVGFANVMVDESSVVEGVLYDINDKDIYKLDKYEGYPKHYTRVSLSVKSNGKLVNAIVYLAKTNWVSKTELKATEEYKSHILEGKKFVTDDYYMLLEKIKT